MIQRDGERGESSGECQSLQVDKWLDTHGEYEVRGLLEAERPLRVAKLASPRSRADNFERYGVVEGRREERDEQRRRRRMD